MNTIEIFEDLKLFGRDFSSLFIYNSCELNQIELLLNELFREFYVANSLDEALKCYTNYYFRNKKRIDIVIIDIDCMHGLEVAKSIKAIDLNQKMVLITDKNTKECFLDALELGVENLLLKPIKLDTLYKILYKVLQRCQEGLELKKAKDYANLLLAQQDKFIKDSIHEINTPLSIIVTNIDLIKIEQGSNEFLTQIEAACMILKNTYEDMHYLIRKEKIEYKNSKIDLLEFVINSIDYFNSIAIANSLKLNFKTNLKKGVYIEFSDIKLQRLIHNNISNAIKYSNRNSVITIKLNLVEDGYKLSFKNFGQPIKDKDAIFERFYREDSSRGGYGIGLNIVKEICYEYGIDIDFKSTPKGENIFSYLFKNRT